MLKALFLRFSAVFALALFLASGEAAQTPAHPMPKVGKETVKSPADRRSST
jgi:hypothetical protein